jgi:predicted ATPase/DNA-binding SARP family transcriptional activator
MRREMAPAPRLSIRLLGPFDARVNGETMPALRTRKGQWLLALLALRQGCAVSRDWLAGTLWPESLEEQALGSLRRSLTDLRSALGPEADRLEAPTARTLCLDLKDAEIDTLRFDETARGEDEELLQAAIALYRGPLLEGCVEEWVLAERAEREETYLRCRVTLARNAALRGDYGAAAEHYRLVILADPLREAAQRSLIEALIASGDFAAAMQTYRDLRNRLRRDYNMDPGPDTTALFQRLRREANARLHNGGHHVTPKVPLPTTATPSSVAVPETEDIDEEPDDLPEPPRRLPRPLTNFVGREKEVTAVAGMLRTKRLMTMVGIGGIGKTRLALACAERLISGRVEAVAEGAYFADLAALTDPALVVRTVASTLEIPEEAGRSLMETLIHALREKRLLLVLDNCEHLLDECATLAVMLLQSCPHLRILATSREPLSVLGETLWNVPPMGLTDPTEQAASSSVLCHEAVRLFVDRAELVKPDFLLTPERACLIARLCQRLDGVALAIELAAARLATMPLEEIATRLDDQMRLLTNGNRGVQPRQQTLSATLDWSFDLLSDEERSLLRRLAVFAGGATLPMIQQVCWTEETPEWLVRDLVSALASKSLLARERSAIGAEGEAEEEGIRYRLLEVVRQYAAERLSDAGETEAIQARHMDAVTTLVKDSFLSMNGPRHAASVVRLTVETDNIRAALGWAFHPDRASDTDRILNAQRMTRAMLRVWALRNDLTEAKAWCARALSATIAVPAGLSDEERAAKECAIGIERARLLSYAGVLERRFGDYDTARTYQLEALALARRWEAVTPSAADPISTALGNLALLADNQGQYEDSMRYRTEGMALERARGDKVQLALFLQNAASIAQRLGDYTTGLAYFEECLALQQEKGDEEGLIWSMAGLADTLHNRQRDGEGQPGDRERRDALRSESLQRARSFGDREGIAYNLAMQARERTDDGDQEMACCHMAECLELLAGMEGSSSAVEPIYVSSWIAFRNGATCDAARLLGATHAILRILNTKITPKEQADLDIYLAGLRAALGDGAFATARAEGERLSIAQAVVLARSIVSPEQAGRSGKEMGQRALK